MNHEMTATGICQILCICQLYVCMCVRETVVCMCVRETVVCVCVCL